MKSLIFADIHAKPAALEAILDAEKTSDEVLFLGDAVGVGPEPDETLSMLAELKGVFLMGNHDRYMIAPGLEANPDDWFVAWLDWTRAQISERNLRFLSMFEETRAVERDGVTLRLLHGEIPRALGGRIWPDSPRQVWAMLAERYPEPVILFGHSHIQFQLRRRGRRFVNPGSAGEPRLGKPGACYAVLQGGRLALKAVPYDVERTCRAMDRLPFPKAYIETWKQAFRAAVLPEPHFSHIRDFAALADKGWR